MSTPRILARPARATQARSRKRRRRCYGEDVSRRVRFGLFEFDPAAASLSREGVPVRLQPQPAACWPSWLLTRARSSPETTLRQEVWNDGTFVDFERGLNFCIAQIRSALGDSADSPRFIETLPAARLPIHRACLAAVQPRTGAGSTSWRDAERQPCRRDPVAHTRAAGPRSARSATQRRHDSAPIARPQARAVVVLITLAP